jgi:hypothetical protein
VIVDESQFLDEICFKSTEIGDQIWEQGLIGLIADE